MDLEKSPEKKAVLIGWNHPNPPEMNAIDIKRQILRMKNHLMEHRGFSEDSITLITEDEDDDDDEKHLQPTAVNIREQLYEMVEYAYPGDILFIHLIAYGCSDGFILTPDKKHIPDSYFRSLIWRAVEKGCNLTVVSDCLIQPCTRCPCPQIPTPKIDWEERRKKLLELAFNPKLISEAKYVTGYYKFVSPTNLSCVDILNLEQEEEEDKTETSSLPSCVILFTPFQCDQNAAAPWSPDNESEVFFPPPKGTKHTSYGAFTNSLLDVIEETHGRITNLELAQKAMEKLGQIPGLSCSHHHHAYTSFVR